MSVEIKDKGNYELFKTTEDNEILCFEDKNYAFIEGKKGDIIVYSTTDYSDKKDNMVSKGKFYYADFKNDENFKAMPHFFMEFEDHFKEILLPNGFPTKNDNQKKLIRVDDKLPRSKVLESLDLERNKDILKEKTKEELYEIAKKEKIEGRSELNKEELIEELAG